MRKLADAVEEGSPVLSLVGNAFQSVGMAQEAVTAFLKVRLFRGSKRSSIEKVGLTAACKGVDLHRGIV